MDVAAHFLAFGRSTRASQNSSGPLVASALGALFRGRQRVDHLIDRLGSEIAGARGGRACWRPSRRDPSQECAASRRSYRESAKYLEIEPDGFSLCKAIAVVSSVVTDQLSNPLDVPKVQTFRIDAGTLRYAVDHATELAVHLHRALVGYLPLG
jgi:hypothetical protein